MAYTTYTIEGYIQSKQSIRDKIIAIDVLIDKMMLSTLEAIDGMNGSVAEYDLDDTQVRVRTRYRSIAEIKNGIHALEQMKQMYVNRIQGRVGTLVDERNLRR